MSVQLHEDDAADQLAVAAPPGQPPRFFKLPDFWTASPAAWLGVAEAQFLLRGTTSQRDRFALFAPSCQRCPPAGWPTSSPPLVTTVITTSGLLSCCLTSSPLTRRPRSSSPWSHWGTAAPLTFSPRGWSTSTLVRSSPVSLPCCSYAASLLQSTCS